MIFCTVLQMTLVAGLGIWSPSKGIIAVRKQRCCMKTSQKELKQMTPFLIASILCIMNNQELNVSNGLKSPTLKPLLGSNENLGTLISLFDP